MARITKKQQTEAAIKELAHSYAEYLTQLRAQKEDTFRKDFAREWVKDCQARLRDLGYDIRLVSLDY